MTVQATEKPDQLRKLLCIDGKHNILVTTDNRVTSINDMSYMTGDDQGAPKSRNIAYLELNTSTMTLDLVIFMVNRREYWADKLASFTWDQVTQEFLDTISKANQRIRSWV